MSTVVSEEYVVSFFRIEEYHEREISVKAGGKQTNRHPEISDFIGIKGETDLYRKRYKSS
jgi:hypothetical protein